MSNTYQINFNNSNGTKGFVELVKNVNFLESMCDGIYLKYKVPASTTETTMTLLWGFISIDLVFSISLTEPVDEYITVVLNIVNDDTNELYSTMCICPAGAKFAEAPINVDASYMYSAKSIYVYVGKRLVLSAEGHDEILNNIINLWMASTDLSIVRYLDANGNEISKSELNTHKLTCNDETLYIAPLVKTEFTNSYDTRVYLPAVRYNGVIYTPGVKITNTEEPTENDIKDIDKHIPVIDVDIPEEVKKDIVKEQTVQNIYVIGGGAYEKDGSILYMKMMFIGDHTSLDSVTPVRLLVDVKSGEEVVEMPIRDKDGNIIDYIMLAKDKETGEIGDVTTAVPWSGDTYSFKTLDDGSTVAIGKDGSITINTGQNRESGNTITYYPTGGTSESGNPLYSGGGYNPENPYGGETEFDPSWFDE